MNSNCKTTAHPPGSTTWLRRLFWSLAILFSIGLFWLGQKFAPELTRSLPAWVERMGVWGPLGFGAVYVLAVVLLIPASLLTLAAGALFGVARGMLIVSLASNLGAALAFLIARYLARGRVERWLSGSPRLLAVDQAVDEAGWRLVALLRLSPAVPFNVQNYLYGLTSLCFWPCVLTSWVTMLPGTLLYVMLGQAGRAGLEVAGGQRLRSPAEWALLASGLLATLGLTLFLTRLVGRRLAALHGNLAVGVASHKPAKPPASLKPME